MIKSKKIGSRGIMLAILVLLAIIATIAAWLSLMPFYGIAKLLEELLRAFCSCS